jgi:hypothetical protein
MNGRFAKFLIFILCGALILIAGCTTTAPTGGAAPTPAGGTTPVATTNPDLGTIVSLLRTIGDKVSLVAENTQQETKSIVTGNIILFDTMGNTANAIKSGKAIVALPDGSCEIAIYAQSVPLYTTVEEEKDLSANVDKRYYRNRQTCFDDPMCRETVSLDDNFSFLYIEYKSYNPSDSLNQVTLSYRCTPD